MASSKKVGVLGGGQLGRMLAASASLLNIPILFLDPSPISPAKQVAVPPPPLRHITGSFTEASAIRLLADQVDIITVEIEHVDAEGLAELQRTTDVEVYPSPQTLRIIQDKFCQKEHLRSRGIPVAAYVGVEGVQGVRAAAEQLGLPLMLKSRTLAYDGRGNYVLRGTDEAAIQDALRALHDRPLYAEKWVPFAREAAVMVVRSNEGSVLSYPVVETVHRENICHLVFAPLRAAEDIIQRARKVAEDAVSTFDGAGVFGVEMFLLDDDTIYINEIAPRPHNSGHYTIEACHTSQYENHLRAILSLPLGSTALVTRAAAMLNLLGSSPSMKPILAVANVALTLPGAHLHLYGKSECRKGRKMGHITLVADSDAQCRDLLRELLMALPPGGAENAEIDAVSPSPHPSIPLYTPLHKDPGISHSFPLVSIIMGSDSDLPVMRPAAAILAQFQVPHELTIVSAHRTVDRMVRFARGARARGVRVIIAGAGGAAHLPGMVAALSPLPVIGVPIKGSSLDGVDSLHSIVQMPRGVPVATVAINNALNGGLLAARILGAGNPDFTDRVEMYTREMEDTVITKVEKLEAMGWEVFPGDK